MNFRCLLFDHYLVGFLHKNGKCTHRRADDLDLPKDIQAKAQHDSLTPEKRALPAQGLHMPRPAAAFYLFIVSLCSPCFLNS